MGIFGNRMGIGTSGTNSRLYYAKGTCTNRILFLLFLLFFLLRLFFLFSFFPSSFSFSSLFFLSILFPRLPFLHRSPLRIACDVSQHMHSHGEPKRSGAGGSCRGIGGVGTNGRNRSSGTCWIDYWRG